MKSTKIEFRVKNLFLASHSKNLSISVSNVVLHVGAVYIVQHVHEDAHSLRDVHHVYGHASWWSRRATLDELEILLLDDVVHPQLELVLLRRVRYLVRCAVDVE